MPFTDNPDVRMSLPPETPIWRYTSFTTFLAFLEYSSLHFTQLESLGDPFEGTLPRANLSLPRAPEIELDEFLHALVRNNRYVRQRLYANCWYANAYESAAMWRLYSSFGEGVAIRST